MSRANREFWFRIACVAMVAAVVMPQTRTAVGHQADEPADRPADEVSPTESESSGSAPADDNSPIQLGRVESAEYLHRAVRSAPLDPHDRQSCPASFVHSTILDFRAGIELTIVIHDGTGFRLDRMLPDIHPLAPPLSA